MGNTRILLFSDTHAPYHHKDTIPFISAIKKEYDINGIYHLGDEIDNHYLNFHSKEQTILNPVGERTGAIKFLRQLQDLFPKMDLVKSNHGDLSQRKAQAIGLLPDDIVSRKVRLGIESDWNWHENLTFKLPNRQPVYITHNYKANALQASKDIGCSLVQGHQHTKCSLQFWNSHSGVNFGLQLPCLIDKHSHAFNYINPFRGSILLGAAVIINCIPKIIPLIEEKSGAWNRKIN